ncbi:hypothetical protein [Nocardia grenadensis]|uniref:hypothetical protein n=1 Tax=Nocardia grenadensis TaxID=931537 RepID=UPI003D752027
MGANAHLLRSRIDELTAEDKKLLSIKAIRDTLDDPCPGLYEYQDLLLERYTELALPWFRPTPPLDLDDLTDRVSARDPGPNAIEVEWDGDSTGWFLCMRAVTPAGAHHLAVIRHGTDRRLFNGHAPPFSEAAEAIEVGCALAARFGIPFHFESPDKPG